MDREYISTLAPRDQETLSRWEADRCVMLREHYRVAHLREDHLMLLDSALSEWKAREAVVLDGYNRHLERRDRYADDDELGLGELVPLPFQEWFSSLHQRLWDGRLTGKSDRLSFLLHHADDVVWNIGWCDMFAAFLPLAVPTMQAQLARTGVTVASIFYMERIDKRLQSMKAAREVGGQPHLLTLEPDLGPYGNFHNVDGSWRRAKELS